MKLTRAHCHLKLRLGCQNCHAAGQGPGGLAYLSSRSVSADMADSFGMDNGEELEDVLKAFADLREAGVLLHYWP